MTDDKAIDAALDAWYGNTNWRGHDDSAERHDMRAAFTAAGKVLAEGFDAEIAELDIEAPTWAAFGRRCFTAGLAVAYGLDTMEGK